MPDPSRLRRLGGVDCGVGTAPRRRRRRVRHLPARAQAGAEAHRPSPARSGELAPARSRRPRLQAHCGGACDRDRRRAVGRRGKGQDRRPARGRLRPRLPLSGRAERRAHDRGRRGDVQDPRDPVGDHHGQAVRDRRGLRRRPPGADRGARRPRGARARDGRRALPLRQRAPDHAVARHARRRARAAARQPRDRHHAARDRPGVCRQGDPDRDPRAGPARPEDPAPEDRDRARREERLAREGLRDRAGRARDRRRALRGVRATAPPIRRRHVAARRPRAARRQAGPVRGRAGDAARPRPRHLSVRHLVEHDRRRMPRSRWGSARPGSTRSSAWRRRT